MRAGGGWLRSAFYGGRIASAMTVGLAAKGIKAIASRKKGDSGNGNSGSGDSDGDPDDAGDKYTEDSAESTDAADESAAAQTQGGESS